MLIDSDIEQLKIQIQRHFGFSITTIQELKNLQVSIEYSTKKNIGFNTLRRFFGFLASTNPTQQTLDVLSNYLGFQNYYNFKKHINADLEWSNWTRTIKIELDLKISDDDTEWLISQAKTPEIHLKLASIFKSFIYKQNFNALNQLLDSRIFNFNENSKLKFAANVSQLLKHLDAKTLEKITSVLIPNEVFRTHVMHWYVDYSNFNGYYGHLVKAAIPYSKPDSHELLFYELILNYNAFLSQKGSFIPIGIHRVKNDFHPLLNGRCVAYNLVYWKQTNHLEEYEQTWQMVINHLNKSDDLFLFTLEIFPALLILKDFEKTTYLIDNFYEDLLTPTNWSGYHVHMTVLLGYCIQLILENKIKEAVKTFDLINISKLNTSYKEYSLIFYYIIKYHLLKINHKHTEGLLIIENEYLELVEITGFRFFSREYLVNYLDY